MLFCGNKRLEAREYSWIWITHEEKGSFDCFVCHSDIFVLQYINQSLF
jgi:hypothetical protein